MANNNLLFQAFKVSEQSGVISLDDERMVIMSASAFGTLRKDLIENIGNDRMKGFLLRYGWNLGVSDANKVLSRNLPLKDIMKQGPALHMIKGHANVKTLKYDVDFNSDGSVKSVHVEGVWTHSYEAAEHIRQFGQRADGIVILLQTPPLKCTYQNCA